jgi:hypothetical protein
MVRKLQSLAITAFSIALPVFATVIVRTHGIEWPWA